MAGFDLGVEKAKEASWLHNKCRWLNGSGRTAAIASYPRSVRQCVDLTTGQKIIWDHDYFKVVDL